MKTLWACLLASTAILAHSQASPEPAKPPVSFRSIADFDLAYPLSNDWVLATELLRKRESGDTTKSNDVLLAAVYVPKSEMSSGSPFFSLRAYRQPATNCKGSLDAMIAARAQDKKNKPAGDVVEFSVAGREYFRVITPGPAGIHDLVICTTAKGHLLVWNAGAPNDRGLDAIVSTLNSIAPLPERTTRKPAETKDDEKEKTQENPVAAKPGSVRVSLGISRGYLIKKVQPSYPSEARAARIQGTVLLRAVINRTGDVTDLELLDGPIELAGSAVAAVRHWKYKPYLLVGEPVAVATQIQVKYELH